MGVGWFVGEGHFRGEGLAVNPGRPHLLRGAERSHLAFLAAWLKLDSAACSTRHPLPLQRHSEADYDWKGLTCCACCREASRLPCLFFNSLNPELSAWDGGTLLLGLFPSATLLDAHKEVAKDPRGKCSREAVQERRSLREAIDTLPLQPVDTVSLCTARQTWIESRLSTLAKHRYRMRRSKDCHQDLPVRWLSSQDFVQPCTRPQRDIKA